MNTSALFVQVIVWCNLGELQKISFWWESNQIQHFKLLLQIFALLLQIFALLLQIFALLPIFALQFGINHSRVSFL